MMRLSVYVFVLVTTCLTLSAGPTRFVVDDNAYSDGLTQAGQKLVSEHKLLSLETLRREVHTGGVLLELLPVSHERLDPPDLCDRLRESTLAVGTLYKCPDCGGWHFSSSSGFVVNGNGIICTCCHVLLEEDDQIKESYLLAADATGHVFPVLSVLAADTDADTCLLRIQAKGLKALPMRTGSRAGEAVYCLSHPGGYYYMFTQGLISRFNKRSDDSNEQAKNGAPTRPILMLNITAEFAPGSSGAPVVDTSGNVVGQVASIADAGEPAEDDQNQPASPSVPVRFCTATEEILRLSNPNLAKDSRGGMLKPARKSKVKKLGEGFVCPLKKSTPAERPQ